MPYLTLSHGYEGSLGNPFPSELRSSGLGMQSTNVQGTMNPRHTSMRQGFDGYTSDDSWTRYRPSTESGIIKYKAFKRAVQARKAQQVQEKQQ